MVRSVSSAGYAVPKSKFVEDFACWAGPAMSDVVKTLPDGFVHVGSGCDVQKALVGCGIRRDRFQLPLHGEQDGALVFLQLLH